MPVFLKHREPDLIEQMDRADCDPVKLANTYRQFTMINVLLSKWRKIYLEFLKPRMNNRNQVYTLLDIGFGGGDIPLAISAWAEEDGINLEITAIETDHRAFEFALQKEPGPDIHFRNCNSSELVTEGRKYDFVISNHVLHHLDNEELEQLLNDARSLSTKLILYNDIERSDLGYALFTTLTRPVFFRSFIIEDGLTSIRKSFTKKELEQEIPGGWKVRRLFPFRLLLIYEEHGTH